MDYFRQHLPAIRSQKFASLHMEVQPLAAEEYAELKTLGAQTGDGLSGDLS